jgi:uncharacterized protein YneF (UPF0154 family)
VENETSAVKTSGEDTAPPASIKKHGNFAQIVILCMVLSVGSGVLSGWWFGKKFSVQSQKEIVVADTGRIKDEKIKEFVARYKDKEITPEVKAAMEKEVKDFAEKFDGIISEEFDRRIILAPGAVVAGNVKDITEYLQEKIRQSPATE